MINPILNALQTRLNEDLKDTQEIYKILEDDNISYEKRLNATALMFQLHGKTDRLRYAISLIQEMLEQEKLFHQVLTKQCDCQKEKEHNCNCERENDKIVHTKEDDEEFEKIKKQLEVLKQYIPDEIKDAIDNFNFWYENYREDCSLNDYKKYIKAILIVVHKIERTPKTWNNIADQIVIISKLIKVEE